MSLCLKEAERLGVNMVIPKAVNQLWRYGIRQGGGKQNSTRLITYLEQRAGVRVIGKGAKNGYKVAA